MDKTTTYILSIIIAVAFFFIGSFIQFKCNIPFKVEQKRFKTETSGNFDKVNEVVHVDDINVVHIPTPKKPDNLRTDQTYEQNKADSAWYKSTKIIEDTLGTETIELYTPTPLPPETIIKVKRDFNLPVMETVDVGSFTYFTYGVLTGGVIAIIIWLISVL